MGLRCWVALKFLLIAQVIISCADTKPEIRSTITAKDSLTITPSARGSAADEKQTSSDEAYPILTPVVLSSDPVFGFITHPVQVGPYVWVADRPRDPFIHVVDTATKKVILSFGRKGEGPGEFSFVANLMYSISEDSIIAWDPNHQRLTRLASNPLEVGAGQASVSRLQGRVNAILPLGDNLLGISVLGFSGSRRTPHFTLFSRSGEVLRQGHLIWPGFGDSLRTKEERPTVREVFYCTQASGAGFAAAYPYGGRIQLYNDELKLVGHAQVPDSGTEAFRAVKDELDLANPRAYYKSCAFSNAHLFAVFSGEPWNPEQSRLTGTPFSYLEGRELHVFDLRGVLVSRFGLGEAISTISADSGSRWILGTSARGLFRFDVHLSRKARSH